MRVTRHLARRPFGLAAALRVRGISLPSSSPLFRQLPVLVEKSRAALRRTGLDRLVVAGGVGANKRLRVLLDAAAARDGFKVFYPALEFCTDNGAMIALAGTMRLQASRDPENDYRFAVRPRWELAEA